MTRQNNRQLPILLIILLSVFSIHAQNYTAVSPDEMPNVQKSDRSLYVSDPSHLLSASATRHINMQLDTLRAVTTCEVAVAIVPDLGGLEIEDYAEKLFTKWGIGKADKDNGVLLLISPGSRRARIQTGYGVEAALPDMVCDRIISKDIVPNMQNNDLNTATLQAVESIAKVVSDPTYAEELKSSQSDNAEGLNTEEVKEVFIAFVVCIAFGCFILSLVYAIQTSRRLRKSSDHYKAETWRSKLLFFGILAILSLLSALPIFIYALACYKYNRNHTRRCSRCNAKMEKLDEDTDNLYLDPSQDLEEKLGSVDYDVWKCPSCGEIEKYPYKEPNSAYSKCPSCYTHAYHLACTRVLTPATTRHSGRGVKIYKCEYCGHEDHHDYNIPRKDSDAALLGAAAAASAMGRRSHGSGFGGGFGGGATGGGGASGGW